MTTPADHPALSLPPEVAAAQVHSVSTLPRRPLLAFIHATPVLSLRAQRRLAASPHRVIRQQLARHPSLLPDLQTGLALDENQYVRRALATNPSLSPSAARSLAAGVDGARPENAHPFILQHLAGNPATPLSLLDVLHEVESPRNRMLSLALVGNTSFPLDRFGEVEDLDRYHQFVAAKRPGLPRDLLLRFPLSIVHPSVLASERYASILLRFTSTWEGTVGGLLSRVEADLARLSPAERETVLALEPGWSGSWDDLLAAAVPLSA